MSTVAPRRPTRAIVALALAGVLTVGDVGLGIALHNRQRERAQAACFKERRGDPGSRPSAPMPGSIERDRRLLGVDGRCEMPFPQNRWLAQPNGSRPSTGVNPGAERGDGRPDRSRRGPSTTVTSTTAPATNPPSTAAPAGGVTTPTEQ